MARGNVLSAEMVTQAIDDVNSTGVHPLTSESCHSGTPYHEYCTAFTGSGSGGGGGGGNSPAPPPEGGGGPGSGGGGGLPSGHSGQSCFAPLPPAERLNSYDVDKNEMGPMNDRDTSAGGIALGGYVPKTKNGQPAAYSGVTIGFGVDLGQLNTPAALEHYGVPTTLANALKPWMVLQGQDAQDLLNLHPLNLSLTNAQTLSSDVLQGIYNALAASFDTNLSGKQASYNVNFEEFPLGVQTALTDVAYNYGPSFGLSSGAPSTIKNLRTDMESGNWSGVAQDLDDLSGGNPYSRFATDATFVNIAINLHTIPSDDTKGNCPSS